MAMRFMSGFESGLGTNLGGEFFTSQPTVSFVTTPVKRGTYALRLQGSGGVQFKPRNAAGDGNTNLSLSTAYIKFDFRVAAAPSSNQNFVWASNDAGTACVNIRINSSRQITISGATTSGVLATLDLDTWYCIELKAVQNGTCELRIDGVSLGTCTGTNTIIDKCSLGYGSVVGQDFYFDDLGVDDADWVGPGGIRVILPNAAGTNSQWTNGTGTTFAEVDEVPHDSDTTYIMETGTNGTHSFNMESCASKGIQGPIKGVRLLAFVRPLVSGSCSIAVMSISGGTSTTESAATTLVNGSWSSLTHQKNLANDGSAWTTTLIDAMEVGIVNSSTTDARCTLLMAMVWSGESITGTSAMKLPFPWMSASGLQSQEATAALTLPFPVMTSGPLAPQFDAVTTTGQASGTSLSFSHTVGSFNQRALIVSLAYRAATNPNATASSVTYNGVPMSKIRRDSANHRKSEMWVLANPDTGAHNVAVTWDADPEQQVVSANSYYFVDQRAPVATSGGATGSGNAQSVSVTADANQRVVAVGSVYPAGGSNLPATPDANVTERWEYGGPADNINGFGGDRLGAGGATSIGWTHPNTGDTWAISAAVLNPASNNQILSGTGIFTLPFPVVTAVGVGPLDATGTSAMVLPFPRMAVTVGLQIMRGSSALVLPFPVMAGIGAQEYLGTGAFTLPFPVMTAAGTHPVADPPVGTAVLTLPFPVMSGSGYMLPEGTSQLTLPFPVMAGVGEQSLLGTSSLVLPFPVMAGIGEQSQLGTSALVLPFPVMSSSGLISMEGTSALVLPFPVLSSAGTHGASATSALVLPFPVMSAAGIYSEYARYLERLLRILYPTRSIQLINPVRSYNVLLPERKLQVLD